MKFLTALLFSLGFNLAVAADIPAYVEGSENLDKETCIETNTDNCIQSICMTSEDPSCTDNCKQSASDKCAALAE